MNSQEIGWTANNLTRIRIERDRKDKKDEGMGKTKVDMEGFFFIFMGIQVLYFSLSSSCTLGYNN